MKVLRRAALPLAIALACLPLLAAAQDKPVMAPAGYVPQYSLSFGAPGDPATAVTPASPLPTICVSGCSATGAGVASADAPNLTEGQSSGLSFDLDGNLRVTGGGGGGGSGGPTSIADGADVALGGRGDAAWSGTGAGSVTAILKAIRARQDAAQAVTGTFWPTTQPVSAAALPLPAGAATLAAQGTANTTLSAIDTKQAAANDLLADIDAKLGAPLETLLPSGSPTAAKQDITNLALGAPADTACATDTGSCSVAALLKRANELLTLIRTATDPVPITQTACAPGVYRSAASTNATLVSATARVLCSLSIVNTTASVYYLRVYDQATAPNCASATGEKQSFPIPASVSGAGIAPPLGSAGMALTSGFGFCITGGGAANDNTAAATGVTVNYLWR